MSERRKLKRTLVILAIVAPLLFSITVFAKSTKPGSAATSKVNPIPGPIVTPLEVTIFKETPLSDLSHVDDPITMDEAVKIGLLNSQKIKLAKTNIKLQAAKHKQATAKVWPSLTVSEYTFLIGGRSAFMRMPPGNLLRVINFHKVLNQEFAVYGKLPIFQPGDVLMPIRVKRFSENASIFKSNNMEVDVAFQVRQDYLKVMHLQEQIAGLQKELPLRILLADKVEKLPPEEEEARQSVKIALHKTEANLSEKKYQLENALLDLKMSMGIDLSSSVSASDQLTYKPWQGETLEKLIHLALIEHPHLREIEQNKKVAKAETLVAQSKLWPSLFGQASGNFRLPQNFPVGMANGVIGIFEGQMPAFDMPKYREISSSKVNEEKLLQQQKAEQLETAKNICQAWNDMIFEAQTIQRKSPQVVEANQTLQKYKPGSLTEPVLQVTKTIDYALETKHKHLEALYKHEYAKSSLTKAAGLIFVPE